LDLENMLVIMFDLESDLRLSNSLMLIPNPTRQYKC
jgi:hypothetical protein